MTDILPRLAALAAELARRNKRRFTHVTTIEMTDAAIVIHLATEPVVIVDPQPAPPGRPINRMKPDRNQTT